MTSETKVPMPYTDCWGYDREQGKKIPVLWPAEGVKTYGDQRASERDAFWMAKVAELDKSLRSFIYEFGDKANSTTVQEARRVLATLTNPRAGETA